MDFTEEMQLNDNHKVNELCQCDASRLTFSSRTDKSRHTTACPYRALVESRIRKLIGEMRLPDDQRQRLLEASGLG